MRTLLGVKLPHQIQVGRVRHLLGCFTRGAGSKRVPEMDQRSVKWKQGGRAARRLASESSNITWTNKCVSQTQSVWSAKRNYSQKHHQNKYKVEVSWSMFLVKASFNRPQVKKPCLLYTLYQVIIDIIQPWLSLVLNHFTVKKLSSAKHCPSAPHPCLCTSWWIPGLWEGLCFAKRIAFLQ